MAHLITNRCSGTFVAHVGVVLEYDRDAIERAIRKYVHAEWRSEYHNAVLFFSESGKVVTVDEVLECDQLVDYFTITEVSLIEA